VRRSAQPDRLRCPTCTDGLLAMSGDDGLAPGTCDQCFGRLVSARDVDLACETNALPLIPDHVGPGDPDFLCPICGGPFAQVASGGVEVDVCTRCGARWFDVGESEVAARWISGAHELSESTATPRTDTDLEHTAVAVASTTPPGFLETLVVAVFRFLTWPWQQASPKSWTAVTVCEECETEVTLDRSLTTNLSVLFESFEPFDASFKRPADIFGPGLRRCASCSHVFCRDCADERYPRPWVTAWNCPACGHTFRTEDRTPHDG
jgi:Zn-finger nucleic acid-binding protein